ncbi:MAG: hypothetical protein L6M37_03155 [Candidatus Methylarchaceae archaeon HK02M1]|nr:hypothetical protein [Candidatus Methylarchaceae archaeon HK02M1]
MISEVLNQFRHFFITHGYELIMFFSGKLAKLRKVEEHVAFCFEAASPSGIMLENLFHT